MWEMIERMAGDRLWIYTAIAGSLLGAAFLAWFQGTRMGIWAYGIFDNTLNFLVERWGWTWFEKDIDSPYMNFAVPFKKEMKDKVPAVVHLDGTGRIQTVTENDNKWYYNFIKKWFAISGVPISLNTSFNDREPIVETPEHAINCFLRTDIDYLYFRDCNILLSKR